MDPVWTTPCSAWRPAPVWLSEIVMGNVQEMLPDVDSASREKPAAAGSRSVRVPDVLLASMRAGMAVNATRTSPEVVWSVVSPLRRSRRRHR